MDRRHAFSLVELSIVLVILGLLTGGILAGKSLIRAAELRSVSTDIAKYRAALFSFRDKYFYMPGDLNNATSLWGDNHTDCPDAAIANGTPGTCNGNGDGQIDYANEGPRSWQQLALAGMIEGTYAGTGVQSNPGTVNPASKLANAGFALFYANIGGSTPTPTANRLMFGQPAVAALSMIDAAIRPEEAWNIDNKMDDGLANKGKLQAFTGVLNPSGDCVTAAPAYDLTNSGIACFFVYTLQ